MPPSRRLSSSAGQAEGGFIHAYGLFWDADEVSWFPGPGHGRNLRLLGRIGAVGPNLRVCDFLPQRGIYILYDDYGPYYVGLTRQTALGTRLKQHRVDKHEHSWDRF